MPKLLRFDVFEADLSAGQLLKRGSKVSLREKSFQVLASLLERSGEVVTREELRRRLWPDDVFVDFDNNLNAAIAKLRETLGDSAEHPRFIETLPKHGYRFLAKVTEAAPVPEPVPKVRLLVLPFLNLSGVPEKEYFSDAMTDEIITELARTLPEQLAVIARTTAMHYKGSHQDVARIARELDVDYVVEGCVHQADNHFRITTQLIRTTDQAHVWAERFDAELRDIFEVQACLARTVVEHIPAVADAARASGALAERVKRRPTEDLAAYNAFTQGRHHLYKWTPEGIAEAKKCFEQAIACDPNFALAHESLGELYWTLGFFGFAPPKEVCSVGLFHALRAVELDNSLANTHALIGQFRKELDYNWPEVHREMAQALQLDPTSPDVRLRYAMSDLMPPGRLDEAAAELARVLEADPLNLNARVWLSVMFWLGRRYDLAIEQAEKLIELDARYYVGYMLMGQIRCMQHRLEDAIPPLRKAAEISGRVPIVLGWLGLALAQGGHEVEARRQLAQLHVIASQAYVPPTSFAWLHFGLGEIDEAFIWMDRAIEARDPMIVPIKTYPFLDPLRADPRFPALLRKMNLEL